MIILLNSEYARRVFFIISTILCLISPDARAEAPAPALFYIEFHIEADIRNKAEFEIETALLQRLGEVLEKHRARGSFMFVERYPRMAGTYGSGAGNIITSLEKRGHEIGVHYHISGSGDATIASTIEALKDTGAKKVESLTTSFQRFPEKETEICVYNAKKQDARLGRMLDDAYAGGISSAFRWCMQDTTPYRPERDNWIVSNRNDCRNEENVEAPNSRIVAVGMYDGAGYTFPERDGAFKEMIDRIKAAIPRFEGEGVHYFPLAIHDYYFYLPAETGVVQGPPSINESRLKEFDTFLNAIDEYARKGLLRYATRREVTAAFSDWERARRKDSQGEQRLRVFYIVPVHSAADDRPEFSKLSRAEFDETVKTLEAISRTLETHRAKGSFHIMQNFAEAVRVYQGTESNILTDLEQRSHEIGAHVHTDRFNQWQKTRDAILATGVKKVEVLSGMKATSVPENQAFKRLAELGFTVTTGNNSPLDLFPLEGFRGRSFWGVRGNELYKKTGSFIHPWQPDYEGNSIAKRNSSGKIVYLDTVPPNVWISGNGTLGFSDFARLKSYFDEALANLQGEQMTTWGFSAPETEYQTEKGSSMKPLDDFLSYLDGHGASIVWTTPHEVYTEFMTRKRKER